ncbi:MAG: hypothetical protein JWN02_1173, partial [Acidobacteria bacterium]|nr:hypothetical protein [Acidobacteriota bacterium]
GNLINEGIVASMALLGELSVELMNEGQQLQRLRLPWGNYIGFAPAIAGVELVGIRLLGMVSLKGLDNIDVGEIVPFAPGEAEATPLDSSEALVALLRQEFHQHDDEPSRAFDPSGSLLDTTTTTERLIESEIIICLSPRPEEQEDDVVIGEWDPRSDDVTRPLRFPRGDFQRLFSLKGELTAEILSSRKDTVRELYHRLSDRAETEAVSLATYRDNDYETFVLGAIVEKL